MNIITFVVVSLVIVAFLFVVVDTVVVRAKTT